MRQKITSRIVSALEPRSAPFEVRDSELKGFLIRVQPTGLATYMCDFRRPNGQRNRITLGRVGVISVAQARDLAIQTLAELSLGEDPSNAGRKQQLTLAQFLDRHFRPWAATNRKDGIASIKRVVNHFADHLNVELNLINPWLVEKWRSEKLKVGLKPATINRTLACFKSILNAAVRWEFVESNPLSKIKLKATDNTRVRFLSDEEESRLRTALDQRHLDRQARRQNANRWRAARHYLEFQTLNGDFSDHLHPMVILSLNTGVRRGELFRLKWANVELVRQILTVPAHISKNGKSRHIPLNDEAAETLRSWQKSSKTCVDGLVFSSKNGGPFDNVKRAWENLLEAAKIEDFRWHDMRHHFASTLVMNGIDLNTVRELLGHKDIKMVLRYAHLSPSVLRKAVESLKISRTRILSSGAENDR